MEAKMKTGKTEHERRQYREVLKKNDVRENKGNIRVKH